MWPSWRRGVSEEDISFVRIGARSRLLVNVGLVVKVNYSLYTFLPGESL